MEYRAPTKKEVELSQELSGYMDLTLGNESNWFLVFQKEDQVGMLKSGRTSPDVHRALIAEAIQAVQDNPNGEWQV